MVVALRASESVMVQDNSPQLSLDRYPMPLLDTPQSITAISQATIHEEGATTLRDTLRNAPGISLAAGEGGSQGDNLTLRGFTARNDIFLDGMRDFGSYYRDSFNYQEVEVLEGPSGGDLRTRFDRRCHQPGEQDAGRSSLRDRRRRFWHRHHAALYCGHQPAGEEPWPREQRFGSI